jgi:hypothetical protein
MPDGNKLPNENDSLAFGRGKTCSDRPLGEAPQRDGTRTHETTNGTWAGQRPTLVQTASLIRHPAGAGNGSATGLIPSRKSHLARLVDAVQESRRLQAARASRPTLHLVQGERG